jgi:hypothetical protein
LNLSSALSLPLSPVFVVVVVVVAKDIHYFVFPPDFVLKNGGPNAVFCVSMRYCSTMNFMLCLKLIVARIANTYFFKFLLGKNSIWFNPNKLPSTKQKLQLNT